MLQLSDNSFGLIHFFLLLTPLNLLWAHLEDPSPWPPCKFCKCFSKDFHLATISSPWQLSVPLGQVVLKQQTSRGGWFCSEPMKLSWSICVTQAFTSYSSISFSGWACGITKQQHTCQISFAQYFAGMCRRIARFFIRSLARSTWIRVLAILAHIWVTCFVQWILPVKNGRGCWDLPLWATGHSGNLCLQGSDRQTSSCNIWEWLSIATPHVDPGIYPRWQIKKQVQIPPHLVLLTCYSKDHAA